MQIEHQEQGTKGEWYVAQKDQHLAEMTYSRAGDDKFIIEHTNVDDSPRGQGIGNQLLDGTGAWAPEKGQNYSTLPFCQVGV